MKKLDDCRLHGADHGHCFWLCKCDCMKETEIEAKNYD